MPTIMRYLCTTICAFGIGVQALTASATIDPKVQTVLDEMAKAYSSIHAYHSTSTSVVKVDNRGDVIETQEFKVLRPNKFYSYESFKPFTSKADITIVVSDGTYLWHYTSDTNTYTKKPAPKTLDADVPSLEGSFMGDAKKWRSEFAQYKSVNLGDPTNVDGTECNIIKFVQSDIHQKLIGALYIGMPDHLIHRFTATSWSYYDPIPIKSNAEVTINIDTNPMFTNKTFQFTPPAGAKLAAPRVTAKPAVKAKARKK